MAVSDIYVLPSNYPKFDWANWPESAAALVPDGLTYEFEKEAWNAVVNLLANALADIGEEWSDEYTPAAGARITEEYGDLRAAAINSVRHNIDTTVPGLRWGWAHDPTFRGYIGRKDFRGVDAYGELGADDVYPEYITELVARLNFMLSVLTGEAAKVLQSENLSSSTHDASLLDRPSYALAGSELSRASHEAFVQVRNLRALSTEQLLESTYSVALRRDIAAQMRHESILLSAYRGRTAKLLAIRLGGYRHTFISKYLAAMDINNARPVAAKHRSWSHQSSKMSQPEAGVLGFFRGKETTLYTATSAPVQSLRLSGAYQSATNHSVEVVPAESYSVTARGKAKAICASRLNAAYDIGQTEGKSNTSVTVSIDSAWYPPVWVDGGLWIRQAHSVTQNDDGSLEVV